jgi:hypothetical protein
VAAGEVWFSELKFLPIVPRAVNSEDTIEGIAVIDG